LKQLDYKLGKWIKERYGSQVAFSDKMGVHPTRVSKWLKAQDGISSDYQAAIRKLGYVGPWPAEEAQDQAAGGPAPYVTREELAELRGALRAHIEQWERGQEKVLRRLEALARKLSLPEEDD
jgi:hypothetical protein